MENLLFYKLESLLHQHNVRVNNSAIFGFDHIKCTPGPERTLHCSVRYVSRIRVPPALKVNKEFHKMDID